MKAIVLEQPERLVAADVDAPPGPGPGEALVRVRRVGICGTDLHAYRGNQPFFTYPRILGHELGVEVIEAEPNERGIAAGQLCAVEPYLSCGACVACRREKPNCCVSLKVLGVHVDGGMREVIAVPLEKLHRSGDLSADELALVETLGIGAHAVDRAQLTSGELALVIGAGPIGLAVTQFAVLGGARVAVLEANPRRLSFCRDWFPAIEAIDGLHDPRERLEAISGGELPTVVFDATGNPQSMMASFRYVAHGGKLVFVGLFQGDVTFHDPDFHRRELTLLGSRNSRPQDFQRILRLMEAGHVNTAPWITHRAGFDSLVAEFPGWLKAETGVVKAMLELE